MSAFRFSSSWPDPNSPFLSKIDFGVPLVELFKWLDVRDTLLGQNHKKQDIAKALALARECKHPDAVWLSSIFEGKGVSSEEGAREVFLSTDDDSRSLCFAWCMAETRWRDLSLLVRAAEMENAFALATLAVELGFEDVEVSFRLAQRAAAQCERDGFFRLGYYLACGHGCELNFKLACANYLIAAELGCVLSATYYGASMDLSDPSRWLWMGRAASRGLPYPFLDAFSGCDSASGVFVIGRALRGNIDLEKKEIFGSPRSFRSIVSAAIRAFSFYDTQINRARLAVDSWTLVGIRVGIVKDVRKLIGKIIWESRFDANYK